MDILTGLDGLPAVPLRPCQQPLAWLGCGMPRLQPQPGAGGGLEEGDLEQVASSLFMCQKERREDQKMSFRAPREERPLGCCAGPASLP